MHGRSLDGIALSSVWLFMVPAFMSVKKHVVGFAMRVFTMVWVVLLCVFINLLVCAAR